MSDTRDCDVCAGTGTHESKLCICDGTGRARDAVVGLRRLYFELEQQVESLRAELVQVKAERDASDEHSKHLTVTSDLLYKERVEFKQQRDALLADKERLVKLLDKIHNASRLAYDEAQNVLTPLQVMADARAEQHEIEDVARKPVSQEPAK